MRLVRRSVTISTSPPGLNCTCAGPAALQVRPASVGRGQGSVAAVLIGREEPAICDKPPFVPMRKAVMLPAPPEFRTYNKSSETVKLIGLSPPEGTLLTKTKPASSTTSKTEISLLKALTANSHSPPSLKIKEPCASSRPPVPCPPVATVSRARNSPSGSRLKIATPLLASALVKTNTAPTPRWPLACPWANVAELEAEIPRIIPQIVAKLNARLGFFPGLLLVSFPLPSLIFTVIFSPLFSSY